MKTILALNFGSSSIKFAVFHGKERILHGLVQRGRPKFCVNLQSKV